MMPYIFFPVRETRGKRERESAGLTTCRPREAPGNKVVLTGHVNTCPTGVSVVVFHMAARLGLETTIF